MMIRNNKGVTLVEVMVVVLISTIVLAGIYTTFIVGNRAWMHYSDTVIIKKDLRRALFAMINELREAENVRVIEGVGFSALHFYRPASGTISYLWSQKGEDAHRIIRQNLHGKRILAKNITQLSFYNVKDAIIIDITASKLKKSGEMAQIALKEKVALRSKTSIFQD